MKEYEEYKKELIDMVDYKLNKLEPELVQRIFSESGADGFNKTRRITENIFYWSGKTEEQRHEVMNMFGIKFKKVTKEENNKCVK